MPQRGAHAIIGHGARPPYRGESAGQSAPSNPTLSLAHQSAFIYVRVKAQSNPHAFLVFSERGQQGALADRARSHDFTRSKGCIGPTKRGHQSTSTGGPRSRDSRSSRAGVARCRAPRSSSLALLASWARPGSANPLIPKPITCWPARRSPSTIMNGNRPPPRMRPSRSRAAAVLLCEGN